MCIKCVIVAAIKEVEAMATNTEQVKEGGLVAENLLNDDDKFQIQQTVLKFASQNYIPNLNDYAKELCEAVKAIKAYQ